MPGKDRTGPLGSGSRTGRGMGDCNTTGKLNSSNPNFQQPADSFGIGRRLWDITLGRLFRRGRINSTNRFHRNVR